MLMFYAFCTIVIVQEVVRRFVLNLSSAWGEEAARYAFIYLGWLGAAYAVRERAHIRFDVVLSRLKPRAKAGVFMLAEVVTIIFAVVAFYWSMHTIATLLKFQAATPVLRVSKVWFEAAVPIAFALVVFRSLQRLVGDYRDMRAGRAPFAGKAMFEE